jgi:hypothetical protein
MSENEITIVGPGLEAILVKEEKSKDPCEGCGFKDVCKPWDPKEVSV